jgi:hypothetical protein
MKFFNTIKQEIITNPLEWIARFGVFGTFLGHGIVAIGINPKWIPLLTTFGLNVKQAVFIMPIIGILDIVVACSVLIRLNRYILIWAVFWAFLTALSRPLSGGEILEFVERSANWCLPTVLLLFEYYSKKKEGLQIEF